MRTSGKIGFAIVLVVTVMSVGSADAKGGGCHKAEGQRATEGAGTSIDISQCRMNPTILSVEPGSTVTFVNNDEFKLPHNVLGLGWGVDMLNAGGSFTHRFDAAGIYPYACTFHPGMVGAIVAGDGGGGGDTAAGLPISTAGGETIKDEDSATGIVIASVIGVLVVALLAAAIAARGQLWNRLANPIRSAGRKNPSVHS